MVEWPAPSRATAVIAWLPSPAAEESQVSVYGGDEMGDPTGAPSISNWTEVTPTSSDAVAESVTDPETAAPGAGSVIETVGEPGCGERVEQGDRGAVVEAAAGG